ncbi:MAG: phage resistance protein [Leptothrix sp. (in: b-proteobacteria)]
MPFIHELIHIPERVHQGDFVLKLSDGVSHAEQTLRDYVVTPQLVDAFANALGFIQQSVATGSSKAAYLHGSFGSGKSHFMAVLNLLLAGNVQARSTPELADVVAKHGWTHGKKFLLVPYHMIGARDMESAILGQYADFVRARHPGAPIPGFYLAEGLFRDASELRQRLGDAAFFQQLNATSGAAGDARDSGWGDLNAGWDAHSMEAAMLEPPKGEERSRLVGDLISQFFTAYRSLAGGEESFVSLDDGLSIMTRHAKELGYDAVILFLDELVLWLASHAADVNFVSREGTKLVKLVEATNADRPIPVVSFVARQRDLRDLVGENLAGSVQTQFSDVLKHWEARFHRITLEDRNLPAIAEKRVLRPVDDAARQTLQAAFDDFMKGRREVLDTLLTTTADREMFRKVYPFSPALVQTLIAVSAALQRERTALKLMLQLLVDRRSDLELGQLIPVGDLYDAIAEGDEPFSEGMRVHFDNAKRLYAQRLLPMLERQHGVTWEAIKLGQADPAAAKNLRNDSRLLKTLLLGALVPEVESLKSLTAQRLTALNHGTFRTPIPGREAQDVLRKCKNWAAEIGEIRVTEDANPVISIQVTGVDIDPIVRAAESIDNVGNRRRRIRETLFGQLGLEAHGELFVRYAFTWRGTAREVELLYENVREMTDERLRGRSGSWTVVLDFPFDDGGYGPKDDLARLGNYRGGDAQTLVWMPSFLSNKAQSELGRLIVLDHVLKDANFDGYASYLTLNDRVQARALASSQRDQLRTKLRSNLDVAYGISSEPHEAVSEVLASDEQFRSLDPTMSPRPPVGADFQSAFNSLLGQLLEHQYPAHPEFDIDVKPTVIRKVWVEVQRALEATGYREVVQDTSTKRLVRSIVNPSKLGNMAETHLVLDMHWSSHFNQMHARDGGGAITVARLRQWIDQPRPMGLPIEVQNLVILTYAGITNRRLVLRGGPYTASVDSLSDEVELREQSLPEATHWEIALRRASSFFGLTSAQTLSAANVGRLVEEVRQVATQRKEACGRLVASLRDKCNAYANGASEQSRMKSAASAQAVLALISNSDERDLIRAFATVDVETSEAAVGRTLGQLQSCQLALDSGQWSVFDALRKLTDQRQAKAQSILTLVAEALTSDEHVTPLRSALEQLGRDALQLLTATPVPAPAQATQSATATTPATGTPQAGAQAALPPPPPPLPGEVCLEERQGEKFDATHGQHVLKQLQSKLSDDPNLELTLSWRLVRKGRQT